jgi:hypothetical protein
MNEALAYEKAMNEFFLNIKVGQPASARLAVPIPTPMTMCNAFWGAGGDD